MKSFVFSLHHKIIGATKMEDATLQLNFWVKLFTGSKFQRSFATVHEYLYRKSIILFISFLVSIQLLFLSTACPAYYFTWNIIIIIEIVILSTRKHWHLNKLTNESKILRWECPQKIVDTGRIGNSFYAQNTIITNNNHNSLADD